MNYIHYGHNNFDMTKFDKIANIPAFTKPFGGLWGSRVNAEYGWKTYCEDLGWNDKLEKYFIFSLKDEAKVLIIDNCRLLFNLPKQEGKRLIGLYTVLNFEELAKEYDAVEVLISEDGLLYTELNGWDCDSILVFNPDVIIEEKK